MDVYEEEAMRRLRALAAKEPDWCGDLPMDKQIFVLLSEGLKNSKRWTPAKHQMFKLKIFDSAIRVGRGEAYCLDKKEPEYDRPRVRGDCLSGGMNEERPCPFVGCKYHLFMYVNEETGSISQFHPDLESMSDTCALDIADRGGSALTEIANAMNVTRSRAQQIEAAALAKARAVTEVLRTDRPDRDLAKRRVIENDDPELG